jgi:hypothetical protein
MVVRSIGLKWDETGSGSHPKATFAIIYDVSFGCITRELASARPISFKLLHYRKFSMDGIGPIAGLVPDRSPFSRSLQATWEIQPTGRDFALH